VPHKHTSTQEPQVILTRVLLQQEWRVLTMEAGGWIGAPSVT
jgi:hypothetical protein